MSEQRKEAVLPVTGMTCAACAVRIEKGLNKMDGVEEATVNFALERTSIKYDPSVTNIDKFTKKTNDLGYDIAMKKLNSILVV